VTPGAYVDVRRVANDVVVITLRRGDALNALNLALLHDLRMALREARSARAVLLRGEGRVFCAGADLREVHAMRERSEFARYLAILNTVINDVEALDTPVVAAVQGGAYGGGLELLLASDVIVAAEDARFGLTEVRWGTIPGAGGTQRLGRAVGFRRARTLLLLGEPIDARTATEWGLVWSVVPPQHLDRDSHALATALARSSRSALACLKDLAMGAGAAPSPEGLARESAAAQHIFGTPDHQEGLAAFGERRDPVYVEKETDA
jgi:enoyl-CoA hydratase/carnithine racemase